MLNKLSPELLKYKKYLEKTEKTTISLTLDKNKPAIMDTKIGGIPYWENTKELPKDDNNEQMFLLCQINYSDLPHLEGFGLTGILQFFISGTDGMYGLNLEAICKLRLEIEKFY